MKRVLLVDDDLDLLEVLELILARSYEVRTATDGHAALAVFAAEPVDVAVVDVMMPGMDGDALVAAMHARGIAAPVILASATPELSERASRSRVFAAIAKPFRAEELERCIAAALAAGAGGAEDSPGPNRVMAAGVGDAPGGARAVER